MNIEEFLKAVSTHEMSVLQDDGVWRHIKFNRPGTNCMRFDLVTWPGHLCYTGDMGTFVFSRIVDMFEATTEARIKSAIRLQSGTTAIEYTDAEDDATLKRMEAFTRFQIGIAPFFNGQAFRIDARLKYRQNSAKLTFWYELIRPDLQVQEATRGLIAKIKAELPGVPVLMGTGA